FVHGDGEVEGALESDWVLDELKLGDNKILIERSENAYLAVIFSGEGSKRLRRIVRRLLDKIETRYTRTLPTWDGDIKALAATKEILSVLIKSEEPPKKVLEIKLYIEGASVSEKPSMTRPPSRPSPTIVKSAPLSRAKPMVKGKDLMECIRDQTGASKPGLPAWPLSKSRYRAEHNKDPFKLPLALKIAPRRVMPRTIMIEGDKIKIKGTDKETGLPTEIIEDRPKQTVRIPMRQGERDLVIDPSRSILRQLVEIDDNE
ncbi:hypothetical protein, partial [[Eubacterium] cellulosolvens]